MYTCSRAISHDVFIIDGTQHIVALIAFCGETAKFRHSRDTLSTNDTLEKGNFDTW